MSRDARWWMDDDPAEFRPNWYSDLPFRMQASHAGSWFARDLPPVPSQWAELLQVGPREPWSVPDVFEVVTGRLPDMRDPGRPRASTR